jgi:myo-inositol-1(or 4)-monophosphatase
VNSSKWLEILSEAAENIISSVTKVRLRNEGLDDQKIRHLLDYTAQSALIEALTLRGVSAQIISEEGNVVVGSGGPFIIADPIDGTTNLSRDLRPAVTCLSISENNRLSGTIAAIVADVYNGETWTAETNRGACHDSIPIHTAPLKLAESALISLDISKTLKLERIVPFLTNCRYIRMLGSSANELSLVASGTLDAHIDIRGTIRVTDIAAALTILKEAGGVYSINGVINRDLFLTGETTMELIAASTPQLLEELLYLTKE